jgi:hypothetical protein
MNSFFLDAQQRQRLQSLLSPDAETAYLDLLRTYKTDLTENLFINLTPEMKNKIYQAAGFNLFTNVEGLFQSSGPLSRASFLQIWQDSVRTVAVEKPWLAVQKNSAAPSEFSVEMMEDDEKKTFESRKIMRELVPYLAIFVGLGMLVKIGILYMGSHGYL